MAATGKTPILLYGSTTATNQPSAGNLTNSSDGCEIAINVADKNLFFKDSTNTVNTVPIRQSSASSNGWLSSTDWSTFNSKQAALVSGSNIKTVGGNSLLGSGNVSSFNSDITVNSLTIGLGGGAQSTNTVAGNGALASNSTGNYCSAFGYNALNASTADFNTAFGRIAGASITSGTANCAFGGNSMYQMKTGSYNAAFGTSALFSASNASGSNNSAFGNQSLLNISSGSSNSGFGFQTMYSTDTGSYNTCVGYQSGFGITSGNYNTIIGAYQGSGGPINATGSNYVVLSDGQANIKLVAFPTGGVSIGNTTDPGATNLSVTGTGLFGGIVTSTGSNSGFSVNRRDTSAGAYLLYSAAGNLSFYNQAAAADRMTLTAAGDLSATGTATASSFIPTSSTAPTNGVYLPSSNFLGFSTNGANAGGFDSAKNFYVATTSGPSNTKSGNYYSSLGGMVMESIETIQVGTSPVQITKNGSNGLLVFITANQGGYPYNAILICTANGGVTVVSAPNSLGYGQTVSYSMGGPYNGQLFMSVSGTSGGNLYVNGVSFGINRY